MVQTHQSSSRELIATTLGVSPSAKEISLLSALLGGLQTISAKGSSLIIPVPSHLVRGDLEPTLKKLSGVTLSGDATRIIATRSGAQPKELPSPLAEIQLPPLPANAPELKSSDASVAVTDPKLRPKPIDEKTRQRVSQLLEVLGLSMAEVPNYLTVVATLEKVSNFILRETKNTRSDGCVFIRLEKQDDALTLLQGLGFTRSTAQKGSVWGELSHQRVCYQSETKATANIANTLRGCEITIEFGEPLTESRVLTREFSAIGSVGSTD